MNIAMGNTRRLGAASALLAVVLLSGCAAAFKGAPDRLYTVDVLIQNDKLYAEAIDAAAVAQPDAQRNVRDRFITVRSALIDYQYDLFRSDLYFGRTSGNVGVDVATLGLGGIGAAMASTQVKTVAAALSAFLIGGKASVDKNVYFDRTLPALLEQMDAARATVRKRILDSMLTGTDRYPLMQAAADLEDYFRAGTIPGAIAGLTTQAAAEKKEAVGQLEQRLNSKGFTVLSAVASSTGTRLQNCVEPPGGAVAKERRAALVDWLNARGFNTAPPFGYSDFFTQAINEPLRQQALADSALMTRLKGCV